MRSRTRIDKMNIENAKLEISNAAKIFGFDVVARDTDYGVRADFDGISIFANLDKCDFSVIPDYKYGDVIRGASAQEVISTYYTKQKEKEALRAAGDLDGYF